MVSLGFRVIKTKKGRAKYKNYSAVTNKGTDEDDLHNENKEMHCVKPYSIPSVELNCILLPRR